MSSGETIAYQLPYPVQTDPVDVATDIESLANALDLVLVNKASLSSPTFTGNPTAPTKDSSDDSTSIATTAFIKNQEYLTTSLAQSTYAPLLSPALLGTPTSPTPIIGDNSTKIATTQFIKNALDSFVTLPTQTSPQTVGSFLTSDGSSASWQKIAISNVTNLQSSLDSKAPLNITINEQTSSYVVAPIDAGRQIEMKSSSAIILSVDTDANVLLPIGTVIVVVQTGSGQLSISPFAGVTINATPGLNLRTQWSVATLTKRAANTWLLAGDLVA